MFFVFDFLPPSLKRREGQFEAIYYIDDVKRVIFTLYFIFRFCTHLHTVSPCLEFTQTQLEMDILSN